MTEKTASILQSDIIDMDIEGPQSVSTYIDVDYKVSAKLERVIKNKFGTPAYRFLTGRLDFQDSIHLLMDTTSSHSILKLEKNKYTRITNTKRVNDIRYINKFFEAVNSRLQHGGEFIGRVETKNLRKARILRKYPPGFNYIYYSFDFILKRIFPKLKATKKIYFYLTHGNNRVITKAEALGRLVSCGFKIEDQKVINGYLYFVAKKEKQPLYPQTPTYGPLIRLKRVGKDGKIITVYKLRTMHPFAEYLQAYIYEQNHLEKTGKFRNDFRISTLGSICRKLWIDELPMLINLARGEMKLVGVRPLSKHYFNLYSEELKEKRIKQKPGLFPPFYADLPKSLQEIMDSELKYLEAYEKHPIRTDVRYFCMACTNIIFRRARSK
ncbi:MAG: sugar transferase [bacterium]